MLGAYKVVKKCSSISGSIMKYFIYPRLNLSERYGKGSWALITGASDGLGKQYALELAREGFNIVLMGRNVQKTAAASKEIRIATNVETKMLIFDFAKLETEEAAMELKSLLDQLDVDISILANNCGVLHFGRLGDRDI